MELIKAWSATYSLDCLISDILSKKIKKIIVMTGAGISTPSGISDFRSPGTGLYNNLSQYDIPYPEAIFEKSFFRQNPKPFFTLAKDLIPNIDKYKPNKIHFFLRLLQEKKLLHRLYTQNIDGLESLSGIDQKRLIEAHGSFRSAKCINCKTAYSGIYVKNEVLKDKIPLCKYGGCTGVVKPDIVFFGDKLPDSFYKLHENDFLTADCVIVMGTSLEVEPFANIIKEIRQNAPRLLMNKESVGPFKRIKCSARKKDIQILGDLITCVENFVQNLGWASELDDLILKETQYIESNKNLVLERQYYRLTQETRIVKSGVQRVSKTSLEKRDKIDKLIRKNPLIDKISFNAAQKTKIENTNFTSNKKTLKKFNSKSELDKENKKPVDVESEDTSDGSNEDSDESVVKQVTKEVVKETNHVTEANEFLNVQTKPENKSTTDFLFRRYEFHLKLASNLNNFQTLEDKLANSNFNQQVQRPNSITRINSTLGFNQENQDAAKTNSLQKLFSKNTLFTANSRPLLAKRVQSEFDKKTSLKLL